MMHFAEANYARLYLLTAAALLVAAAFGGHPASNIILAVLVGGVVLLGLPHGALDPQVAREHFAELPGFNRFTFSLAYTTFAASYALLWLRLPVIGLAGFLLIASFHFGSDWQDRGLPLTRLAYGAAVVTVPTLHHASRVATIYRALIGPGDTSQGSELLVHLSQPLALVAIAVALGAAAAQWRRRPLDLLELGAILATALVLDPLLYFTAYFCLLHSPRHLFETARSIGLTTLTAIVRASAPIVVATLALAVILWKLLPAASLDAHLLQIVFIGLAALTVPHMLLETATSRSR